MRCDWCFAALYYDEDGYPRPCDCHEPSDEEQLADLEAKLADPEWLEGPGAVRSELTGVSRADHARALAEALRKRVYPDEEREARQAEQDAYDAHANAALAAAGGRRA